MVKNKMKYRVSAGQTVTKTIVFVLFVIYAVSLLFPFCWMFLNSFKGRNDFLFDVWGLPKQLHFENWVKCFNLTYNNHNILQMFGNSLIYMVGCTSASVFFSAVTAYVLTKYTFPGSKHIYSFTFVLMMIPMVGNTAAAYKLYHDLHFYNTYYGLIITSCSGFGSCFVLLYGFFKNLSWTYAEAAFLDGAGHFSVFFKIMLPMAMPCVAAMAISSAIGIWNDYFTFYMYAPDRVTIALGLQGLVTQTQYGKTSYPELFAAMFASMVPIIILYAATQNLIIKNTVVGGIKG